MNQDDIEDIKMEAAQDYFESLTDEEKEELRADKISWERWEEYFRTQKL